MEEGVGTFACAIICHANVKNKLEEGMMLEIQICLCQEIQGTSLAFGAILPTEKEGRAHFK